MSSKPLSEIIESQRRETGSHSCIVMNNFDEIKQLLHEQLSEQNRDLRESSYGKIK